MQQPGAAGQPQRPGEVELGPLAGTTTGSTAGMLGAGKDGGGAGGGLMAGAAETKATPLPLPSGAGAPVVPGQEPVSALVRATQKQQGPVSVESLPPLGTGGGGAGGVAEADRCLNEMPLLRGVSMQIGRGPSLLMLPVAASDQALMTEYYTRVPPQKGVSVLMPETSEIPVAAAAEGEEGGPEGPAAAPPAAATAVGAGPAGMLAAHPPSEGGPALPPSAAAPPTAIAAGAGAAPAAGAAAAAAAAESAEKQKKAAAVKEAETREYTADEHLMTIAALSERYGTKISEPNIKDSYGLSNEEAESRLRQYGKNVLTPPKQTPEWVKFLKQFTNLFLILLEIAAILGFIAYGLNRDIGNIILAGALLVLISLTAAMAYYQERSASNVINSIKGMLPAACKVIRSGHEFNIPAENLVLGDLVHLTIGNRVPADIRIVQSSDFKVEMSSLTGESDAIECGAEKRSDLPVEARNIIFNSTLVMNGECRGIVIRTGDKTMIGSIAGLAGETRSTRTTMEIEILRVVRFIAALAIITACIFFAIGLARGLGIVFSFVNAFILVLVANVPEGLPATVTSILNLTAQRLAAKNVFIKRTDLIETLGSASVICSDKTGTITQNRMTVENMWFNHTFTHARSEVLKAPPGPAALPPGIAMIRKPTQQEVVQGMTIGRGMSFIALPGGDATAIIHSTTRRGPGALSTATGGRGGGGDDGGGTIGAFGPGVQVVSPSQLTRMATQARRRSAAAAAGGTTAGGGRAGLAGVFAQPPIVSEAATGHGIPEETARVQYPGAGTAGVGAGGVEVMPSSFPEAGGALQQQQQRPSAAAAVPAAGEVPSEERKVPEAEAEALEPRHGAGAPGNELQLRGFGGPTVAEPGIALPTRSTATTSAAARPGLASQPSLPGEATAEGGLDTVESFQGYVPFQSFRGFTRIDWSQANAFSRICTIAAVCNRATFEHAEGTAAEESAEGGRTGAAGGGSAGGQGPGEIAEYPAGATAPGAGDVAAGGDEEDEGGPGARLEGGPGPATTGAKRIFGGRGKGKRAPAAGGGDEETDIGTMGMKRSDTLVGPEAFPIRRGESITRFESVLGKSLPPKFLPAGADTRKVLGDASEAALLRYVDALAPIFEWRSAYPILFEIPFNSVNKWAYAIVPVPEERHLPAAAAATTSTAEPADTATGGAAASNRHNLAFMKGAPERIIDRCSHHFDNGVEVPIDDAYRREWGAAYERFGILGERVLGFAYKVIPAASDPSIYKTDDKSYPLEGLVFAGLVSLVDPPKDGTAEAIALCRSASIKVTMVTGDHPLTAEAISRKVGIITRPTAREVAAMDGVEEASIPLSDPRVRAVILPGYALPELSESDWDMLLSKDEIVFARTSPQQKLQIVEHYQRLGHVVAVTGDGTNDSPALKKADIGVSMGSAAASDVAREAADMVIMDDNFASIVFAIEAGRTVFDNIKKTVAYTVTHALPELWPVFFVLVFDVPLMLTGLLVLTIDLITEQGPAISLSYEPAEASVMARPPRNMKTERLVDLPLIVYSYGIMATLETLTCIMAFFTSMDYYGIPANFVGYHRQLFTWDSPDLVTSSGRTFAAGDQVGILRRAVSAYYFTLIMCQFWHIWFCKTRIVSIFRHPIFENRVTIYGCTVALLFACFIIYTPAVHDLFGANYMFVIWWTCHFAFLLIALVYTEGYKRAARRNPKGFAARYLAW